MKLHNKTRGFLALLSAALCTAFITGCGGNTPENTDPASVTGDVNKDVALELITKIAVNEGLDGDKEIAGYIETGTTLFIDAVDGGEITLPAQVDDAVNDWIAETDLEPSTKASLSMAYDTLKRHYLARIDAGQLDPKTTASIRTIATWVRDAARDTIRYGDDVEYAAPALPKESAQKYGLNDTGGETAYTPSDDREILRQEPVGLSLWDYITSKETREWNRAYYSKDLTPPGEAEGREKLNALRLATQKELEFDTVHGLSGVRTVYGPGPYKVDGRAWMVYANE